MEPFDPSTLFRIVDLAGVLANGLIGGAVARRLRLDPVGFVVLAVLSGLGGGLIRDTLLQAGLPVALWDPAYLSTAFAAAFIAFVLELRSTWSGRFLKLLDAAAIGCWAATGTSKALFLGLSWLPALLMGAITAVGGGMVRDVAVGRIPAVFSGTLYVSTAIIGSAELMILQGLGQPNLGMAVSIATTTFLVVLAGRYGWELPGAADIRAVRVPAVRRRRRRSPTRTHPADPDQSEPGDNPDH